MMTTWRIHAQGSRCEGPVEVSLSHIGDEGMLLYLYKPVRSNIELSSRNIC